MYNLEKLYIFLYIRKVHNKKNKKKTPYNRKRYQKTIQ